MKKIPPRITPRIPIKKIPHENPSWNPFGNLLRIFSRIIQGSPAGSHQESFEGSFRIFSQDPFKNPSKDLFQGSLPRISSKDLLQGSLTRITPRIFQPDTGCLSQRQSFRAVTMATLNSPQTTTNKTTTTTTTTKILTRISLMNQPTPPGRVAPHL